MSYTLLLVDDDADFHQEFADSMDDYAVRWAPNGEEALRLLKKTHDIDLVILDFMMPGMRGTDVLKEIRKIAPDMGVIMLTGHGSKEVAVEAIKGRADDFIEKPFHVEKARDVIRRVLELKGAGGAADDGSTDGKVERVRELVRRNWDKKTSLVDVAEAVCLSPKYLSRVFKEKTGEDFAAYRTQIKMENARRLLKETRETVGRISDGLGYENVESFVRMFKKTAGLTPTEFRAGKERKAPPGGRKKRRKVA